MGTFNTLHVNGYQELCSHCLCCMEFHGRKRASTGWNMKGSGSARIESRFGLFQKRCRGSKGRGLGLAHIWRPNGNKEGVVKGYGGGESCEGED